LIEGSNTMVGPRAGKDIASVIRDRTEIDRAFALAFGDAVRRHRAAGVPMAMWQDDHVVLMDPFDVPIPEEDGEADRNGDG
jgi:hypothetical protein